MTRQKKALQEFKKQERANLKATKATENAEIKMRKRRQAGQNLDYKNNSKSPNDSRGKRMANPITISAQSKFVWDLTNVSQNFIYFNLSNIRRI